jgi:hypothetical protein
LSILLRLLGRLTASMRGGVAGYELLHRIGEGGTGVVWRATRRGPSGATVAVKRVRGSAGHAEVHRLRHEAEVLAELDHPRIVRVLEVVEDADGVAIVMPYAAGGSLERLLAERGRLTPEQAVAVLAPIVDALASAHRRRIVHGDVKPANILFTADGEPLLSDFGVARSLGRQDNPDLGVSGTAEYLDPDVAQGATRLDVRSDIYSMGVVSYEALTGKTPYGGADVAAVLRAADAGTHRPLDEAATDVPEALARAVERALHRRPEERFAGADELATAMREAVGQGTSALPPPLPTGATGGGRTPAPSRRGTRAFGPRPPIPVAPGPRSRRWLGVGAAAGAAFLALVGALALRSAGGSGCPKSQNPPVPPGATVLQGDMDGDGCDTTAVWNQGTLEATVAEDDPAPRRYRLGRPDDVPVLGDWDCDGAATAALYRPSTGETFYFNDWGRSDQPPAGALPAPGPAGSRPEVVPVLKEGKRCAEVRLRVGS